MIKPFRGRAISKCKLKLIDQNIINNFKKNIMKKITGYVLIDESNDSIIGNYDKYSLTEAIQDANDNQKNNKNGCYLVYECIQGTYDENNIVYKSSNLDGKF